MWILFFLELICWNSVFRSSLGNLIRKWDFDHIINHCIFPRNSWIRERNFSIHYFEVREGSICPSKLQVSFRFSELRKNFHFQYSIRKLNGLHYTEILGWIDWRRFEAILRFGKTKFEFYQEFLNHLRIFESSFDKLQFSPVFHSILDFDYRQEISSFF